VDERVNNKVFKVVPPPQQPGSMLALERPPGVDISFSEEIHPFPLQDKKSKEIRVRFIFFFFSQAQTAVLHHGT
jgi:hypothetical protein